MKPHIVKEKNNPHMKRRELAATVDHIAGATPSRAGLQQLLAQEWGVDVGRVDVRNIFTFKGAPRSKITVFVWDEPKVEDLSKPKEKPEEKAEEKRIAQEKPTEAKGGERKEEPEKK